MAKLPIGAQMFCVNDEQEEDWKGVVKQLANAGYDGIELFRRTCGVEPAEAKALVDDLGLKVCGAHAQLGEFDDEKLSETLDFYDAVGCKYLIIPWIPDEMRDSKEAWTKTGEWFSAMAEKIAPRGMRIGYHNHGHEFAPLEGEVPWYLMFDACSPDVIMQVDTGNCYHGGGDPIAALRKYPGRATTVHLKAYCEDGSRKQIGEDDTDWQEVFDVCETIAGAEWYIVEQKLRGMSSVDVLAGALKNLRAMGK